MPEADALLECLPDWETVRMTETATKALAVNAEDASAIMRGSHGVQVARMGGTGLERPAKPLRKQAIAETGGAESGALGGEFDPVDPDLAAVIEAWPKLPEAVRAGILAMVRAAGSGAGDER